jgi:uncharacterized membrane protein YfcA
LIQLSIIALCAFSLEALAGFGGTVLALALGAQLRPLGELLAIFVPANMVLSLGIVVRHFAAVDRRLLIRRIAPAMLAGLPFGLLVNRTAGRALVPLFALVVICLAIVSLLAPRRRASSFWLWLAGVVHGAWGTGGPLVVFVTARELEDRQAIRATLALLWLSLNAILVAGFFLDGSLTRATLSASLLLTPVAAAALFAGELVAARISNRPFRSLGAALLAAAGLLLLYRGA